MNFNKENYVVETLNLNGISLKYRAFRNRIYVEHPVNPDFQQLNIYAPEIYYQGGEVNGYTLHTAPIFLPNMSGGYMPGGLEEPGYFKFGPANTPNTVFRALVHGYVVAVPAIRGRNLRSADNSFSGKAPACILDYKAAVRYLRYFSEEIPGDVNKIISNGTSAGGALSSLLGSTGNHPDYHKLLSDMGAADADDNIFAASCYCPITNLDHADMAYEWQFADIYDFHRMKMEMHEGGRPAFSPEDGMMEDWQIQVSKDTASQFPSYINELNLKDATGELLTLNDKGTGTFLEYLKSIVLASARNAELRGTDISGKSWLHRDESGDLSMDWHEYAKEITRMKVAPAFDALTSDSPENDLFGTAEESCRHFTEYSASHSRTDGNIADTSVIKMMNPMYYIEDSLAAKAAHFRIRHGECDRDTSLAISAILALKLAEQGCQVDYASPWEVPHAGDYDLDELFAWIDGICR